MAVLHYERQITELLVVILELNRKIDRLTLTSCREDEEYLDTGSDLSDHQSLETSSLQLPDWDHVAQSTYPGQPCQTSMPTGEPCDLSRTLHRVLTEIEDGVRTRKAEIPPRGDDCEAEEEARTRWELVTQTIEEVERGLGVGLSPEQQEERTQREEAMECLRARNQQLRERLHGKEQELTVATVAVGRIQLERDRLRLKADELLSSLHDVQQVESAPSSPSSVGRAGYNPISNEPGMTANKVPSFVFEQLMRTFQDCTVPGVRKISRFFQVHGSNVTGVGIRDSEMEAAQLRNSIDEWKEGNDLLSRVLQQCKGDCERLSMLLSKHESNSTALHLALQYSEDCIDTYGKLLVKVGSMETKPDAGEPEADDSVAQLRGDIVGQRQGFTAMKQTILGLQGMSPDLKRYQRAEAEAEAEAGPARREMVPATQDPLSPAFSSRSPGMLQRQSKGKEEQQQDLLTVREDMSWLKGQLSWMKKEKKGLEQTLRSQEPQDEAVILLLTHWKEERDVWLREEPRTDRARKETKPVPTPTTYDEQLAAELSMISVRERHLRDQVEELAASLGRQIENNNIQKDQSEELAMELKRTHSNLSATFRSTKRKSEGQLRRLERQVEAMSERQAAQLQLLQHRLLTLQVKTDRSSGTPL
ncbi:Usher syndrome type-1C protein-binding protein 1 isoform X2 [Amblyraja radiata]|uniref:Usher syndrome type-1C protein-binding protein 1 isoform X2 n=1 Tax=Amblyraja radiata TaxID=386614 RepID=UPI0014026599|nr:Usher syndrome type-1C protein-binding protein 1 isoform X2 [Amblyraja radiata]